MHWILALVLISSGCDRAFGLHRGDTADAPEPDVALDAKGHDDDGDGFDDAIDPCPADHGDTADADGDGVGNLCDPSSTPRDHAILFDTFAAPAAAWVSDSGTWRFGGDAIATDSVGISALIHQDVTPIDHATLEVTFDGTVTVNSYVGPHLRFESGEDISCLLNIGNGNFPSIHVFYGSAFESSIAYPGTGPVHLSISHLASDNTFRCRARRDNELPTDLLYPLTLTTRTTSLAIAVTNTNATVSSTLVLETR